MGPELWKDSERYRPERAETQKPKKKKKHKISTRLDVQRGYQILSQSPRRASNGHLFDTYSVKTHQGEIVKKSGVNKWERFDHPSSPPPWERILGPENSDRFSPMMQAPPAAHNRVISEGSLRVLNGQSQATGTILSRESSRRIPSVKHGDSRPPEQVGARASL